MFTMSVFLQVVDSGSFASAARTMDLSKPTVTRAVAQLEAHLRTRLLQRSTRKVTPTEAGTEYAERCREILATIAEADARAGLERITSAGALRVAMPSALGLALLAPLVAAYCKQYPDVSIDISLLDRPIDLVEEGIDVAIVVDNMLNSDDVVTREASSSRFVACCAPAYLQGPPPRSFAELREQRVLCLKRFAKRLSSAGCMNLHVTTNTAMLRLLAREGLGIAILPEFLISRDFADGSLLKVLEHEELEPIDIQVAYPSRKYLPAKVMHFVDMSLARLATLTPGDVHLPQRRVP
ncbi:LysR family transcriptional regulator [Burkholderia sp. Bp8963]|nr:LysR family transcriptional regulator [Burkholderia sp. Bp8963]